MKRSNPHRRLMLFLALAFFLTELVIGIYGKGFVRGYLGDMLILPFLYCILRIFISEKRWYLPAGLFCLGIVTELLQYLNLCDRMGISRHSLLGILLGSTGDVGDLICYGVGIVLAYWLLP